MKGLDPDKLQVSDPITCLIGVKCGSADIMLGVIG